jgi:hypothetical protein
MTKAGPGSQTDHRESAVGEQPRRSDAFALAGTSVAQRLREHRSATQRSQYPRDERRPLHLGLLLARHGFERPQSRAVQDCSVGRESGAVAGTVPAGLRRMPRHLATHVRADRRDGVESSRGIPVGGDVISIDLDDGGFSGFEIGQRRPSATKCAGDFLDCDVDVLTQEVRDDARTVARSSANRPTTPGSRPEAHSQPRAPRPCHRHPPCRKAGGDEDVLVIGDSPHEGQSIHAEGILSRPAVERLTDIQVLRHEALDQRVALLGAALAFGLGGRDAAARLLDGAVVRGEGAVAQAKQDSQQGADRARAEVEDGATTRRTTRP